MYDKNFPIETNFVRLFLVIFFLVFFTFFATNTNAQGKGKVKGEITDSYTGEALPGANIIVVGTLYGAATTKNGNYVISLKPGEYTLKISFLGYKTVKATISLQKGKTLLQNFKLQRDILGTQQVIVLGTFTTNRTVVNSTVPIDILTAKDIEQTGITQTKELLKMLVPSYNAPENSITDGSDAVRPASLRGLAPDEVLVLVNGKRRHPSALVNVNGTIGRGSAGVDLNAIPVSAIARIEVLRDGASAQYGSDAIAGVINIILKDQLGYSASASVGEYATTEKRGYLKSQGNLPGQTNSPYTWDGKVQDVHITDGLTKSLNMGYGFSINKTGSMRITGIYNKHNYTNRAGLDPRQQYFTINGQPDPREKTFNRLNHRFGDAQTEEVGFFFNNNIPVNDNLHFYSFGGYTYRTALAGGFYRRAKDDRTVRAIYPNGFLPKIYSKLYDGSLVTGLKGSFGKWGYDVSETFGGNTFNFNTKNTLNTSMGTASPTSFDDGSLKLLQSTTNVDFVRQYDIGTAQPLNVAAGLEFRWDNYKLVPGEFASYENGGVPILDGPDSGKAAPVGSQVFPGFSPKNSQNASRTNIGLYVDLENNITSLWTLGIAGRFENYSDFGSTASGKISTRYQFAKGFAVRGAISNGFRAPSLSQEYFSSIATVFIGGEPFEIGTFPVSSAVAKALGAKNLTAETSVNTSAGLTYSINDFDITIDGYLINLNHRIVLSENFRGSGVAAFLKARGINANGGRYFTNAVNTRTKGVDITARYGIRMSKESTLKFILAMNFNKTEITNKDEINTPPQLKAVTDIPLLGRVGQGIIESGQPTTSWNFMANYSLKKWGLVVRVLRFGVFNTFNNNPIRDQIFNPVWTTDVELSYQLMRGLNLAVGSNNLFDAYPDKNYKNNSFNGIFQYNSYTPSGFNGRYIYSRLNVSL